MKSIAKLVTEFLAAHTKGKEVGFYLKDSDETPKFEWGFESKNYEEFINKLADSLTHTSA